MVAPQPAWDGDRWGRIVLRVLLLLIPVATIAATAYIIAWYSFPKASDLVPSTVTQTTVNGATAITTTIITATAPITTTSGGAFDAGLGEGRRFAIAALIFLLGAIVETVLLMLYGTFYVNDQQNRDEPLGLAFGTVRTFLLILIVLILLIFALLPFDWGENKAVTFLFGLLPTVVGFYYGMRSATPASAGGNAGTRTLAASATAQAGCPPGWTCADIGAPTLEGCQVTGGGPWYVQGAGRDIWDRSDQFHYVYQQLGGDGLSLIHI